MEILTVIWINFITKYISLFLFYSFFSSFLFHWESIPDSHINHTQPHDVLKSTTINWYESPEIHRNRRMC